MLSINVRGPQGIKSLVVRYSAAHDAGREVHFTVHDPLDHAVLAKIVVSATALKTNAYDNETLTPEVAEPALEALDLYRLVPALIDERAQQDGVTSLDILSKYNIRILSTELTLQPR